jgi:hypothetical protein
MAASAVGGDALSMAATQRGAAPLAGVPGAAAAAAAAKSAASPPPPAARQRVCVCPLTAVSNEHKYAALVYYCSTT